MENGFRFYVQKFGKFLSGMVMPNIGAFIAWGLITAFFIPTGWTPNATISSLVGPMIFFLLPLLIASSGGRLVHGQRGAVVGAIATMGVIVGALAYGVGYDLAAVNGVTLSETVMDELIEAGSIFGSGLGGTPMFLGAMIMGPLAAFVMKFVDYLLEGRVKTGFEMLVNNFTLGIAGMLTAILGLIVVGPVVEAFSTLLGNLVEAIVEIGLLPVASIFIEPAKILFLNNAINHGILTPLGAEQVLEAGKSVFYLLETNPGPGLGILLAYLVWGKGAVKNSTPGTIIIHFFGGIHEVYFPYVLMKPVLILAVIAGGATGVFVFDVFGAGLVAPASPGSIIAILAMTSSVTDVLVILLGVAASTAVSFLVAGVFLRRENATDEEFAAAQDLMTSMKINTNVQTIVFACDAGMGSSAMGASALRNKFKKAGVNVKVVHSSLEDIPKGTELVVTHRDLVPRAQAQAPNAEIVAIDNFVGAPEYDQLVEKLSKK